MPDDLEALVERARGGDRDSLERLVEQTQRPIYNLALRMLWHPEDARDATQEILIRVITHLGSFRGDGLADVGDKGEWPPDKALLLEEVKVGCMHALLTCLDRHHRLAYILGEILELDGGEAARILSISPTAFRKRLSRARHAIIEFTRGHCGLVEQGNACQCVRRLPRAQAMHRVDADALLFAQSESARTFRDTLEKVRRLELVRRAAALYRSSPRPAPGPELIESIRAALDSR